MSQSANFKTTAKHFLMQMRILNYIDVKILIYYFELLGSEK